MPVDSLTDRANTFQRLRREFASASLPPAEFRRNKADGTWSVDSWIGGAVPTPAQIAQATAILALLAGKFSRARSLDEIIRGTDGQGNLTALTTTQRNALWTNFVGPPRLWETDTGPNAERINDLVQMIADGTAAGTNVRARLLAMYIQDNPRWAVSPVFAPTVNVPGEKAAA